MGYQVGDQKKCINIRNMVSLIHVFSLVLFKILCYVLCNIFTKTMTFMGNGFYAKHQFYGKFEAKC